ncbi:MAG: amidase [Alphaproteobacteria bacterium]|nr:amidase [Alphaproteobacteria bacterium]
MTDHAFLAAKDLARMIRRKETGCEELLNHFLARVEKHNPKLNAIIATDIPRAKKRAREADAALARGEVWGPLHGVPMTVKESNDMAGLPTTWGVPANRNSIAKTDGLAVTRWLNAGVTLFGKTNVPYLLADSQSWNEIYGCTNNPWDETRTPGGSSGGASAALAAGLTGIEMGSDIASSIRNPAHYCGLFGHKPTWGICPPRGHAVGGALRQTDISVIGPLARSARDIALGLDIIAGPDEIDGVGYRLKLPPARRKTLRNLRVGFIFDDANAPVDEEYKSMLIKLADFLRKQKAIVHDNARPDFDFGDAARLFSVMLRAATSGRSADEVYRRNVEEVSRLDPKDDSLSARALRGATISHRDWLQLDEKRTMMRWKWHEYFKNYDVLLCPVMCTPAFPHDHRPSYERTSTINGKIYPAMMETFWAGYTGLPLLPASTAPIGFTKSGLPAGVQIVAAQYEDRTALRVARLLEKEYQAFTPPPRYA